MVAIPRGSSPTQGPTFLSINTQNSLHETHYELLMGPTRRTTMKVRYTILSGVDITYFHWALPDKKCRPPIEEVGNPDFLSSFKDWKVC